MKKHNFSAGPSILPQSVFQKAAKAVIELEDTGLSILETSHRSTKIVNILQDAKQMALHLLQLPSTDYEILFLQGGASMEFCRIPQNLMKINGKAGYINTGRWAKNAMKEAEYFGRVIEIASSEDKNYSYLPKQYTIPTDIDYLHITSNNTIYGTQYKEFPKTQVPIICDMSSDIFSRQIDNTQFSLIYAGAQKNIGPSGISLLAIKKSIIGNTGRKIPNILNYQKHIEHQSMYNTPAVFAIYTSYLNLQWIIEQGGIINVEKRNKQKANTLYTEIDRNPLFEGTAQKQDRSMMNVTFVLKEAKHQDLFEQICQKNNISGIQGHRTVGGYRASIYNAMPQESVEILVQSMQELEKKI